MKLERGATSLDRETRNEIEERRKRSQETKTHATTQNDVKDLGSLPPPGYKAAQI